MKTPSRTIISLFLAALFTSGCWPNFTTYYFFSELEGYIYLNGNPIKNAKIERYYRSGWFKNPTTETAITNEEGYFKFTKAKELVFVEFLHQPTIDQTVKTKIKDSEYVVWSYFKMNYQDLGEFKYSHDNVKTLTGRVTTTIKHDDEKITLHVYIDESVEENNQLDDRSKYHKQN